LPASEQIRLRLTFFGAVQGVGFRPFVFRLAGELDLRGWVINDATGLTLEVEGPADRVAEFECRLTREKPDASVILGSERSVLTIAGFEKFEIRGSTVDQPKSAAVLPDLATCADCLAELRNPAERRFGYPFTNCTQCGPRFSIVLDVPYDRPNTTMRGFALCEACRAEYENPLDRRFHAQPIACPVCGPALTVSIGAAVSALREGGIVALKGIGGYQLLCDALNEDAVRRLRQRKRREAKPLAVMMPSLERARDFATISATEEGMLKSSAAPIVLLEPGVRRLAASVSADSPYLGIMLPYTPLHHLLLAEFDGPVVATSGNLSGEPIATDDADALERLSGIADLFVAHNRPIARACDDSLGRVFAGREIVMRRARGFAPLPVRVSRTLPPLLAVGSHLKNTVAIAVGNQVIVSQHIGDLDTPEARAAFEQTIADLCRLYDFKPEAVVCDLHPDYASTAWARSSGLPVIAVQHHQAHAASCAGENDLNEPHLAIAWDGTGLGSDGAIWGSEMFLVDQQAITRYGHLRPFLLPGGDAAAHEGWRSAMALLHQAEIDSPAFENRVVSQMIAKRFNAPVTTSMGRLFDAISAMAGIARESRFEGQAAMMLERAADLNETGSYPLELHNGEYDWREMVRAVVRDRNAGVTPQAIAMRFHRTLANWVLAAARDTKVRTVALSGGVFQNALLTRLTWDALTGAGIQVAIHQRIPPNDGGISLGQILLAASRTR
jgi:hydrogenase maturation protein HypF